jgi:hypothetical protein
MCDSTNNNILPINLDRDAMVNSSPQLSDFLYDFLPQNSFTLSNSLPEWMNTDGVDREGALKIVQGQYNEEEFLKFSTIGPLEGTNPSDKKICIYYFPEALNMYDSKHPDGGEILIELQEANGDGSKKNLEALFIFIPVEIKQEETKSSKWFSKIIPTSIPTSVTQHQTSSTSLNDIIPRGTFWIYNDVCLHNNRYFYKKVNVVFFLDDYINISSTNHDICSQMTGNINNLMTLSLKKNCLDDDGKPLSESVWCDNWYETIKTEDITNGQDGNTEGASAGAISRKAPNSVKRGSIFKNDNGTKNGPGDHGKVGDPFSLTCEPIVDVNENPLYGDRTEWVSGVLNSVPEEMKNMFWLLIFIVVLTVILMTIHVIIFKNIGLFITQSEIAGRANKI